MRQTTKFLISLFIIFLINSNSFASIKAGIEYKIPIEYNNLNEAELAQKAEMYYEKAFNSGQVNISTDMTDALNLYGILSAKCPENLFYAVRLGSLYDHIGKNRIAKGHFYRAIGIDSNNPISYFYLGEFYYKRELYRKALKFYLLAYAKGDTSNYNLLYKAGDIYQKFGDKQNALNFLLLAQKLNPNEDLSKKISQIEDNN